MKLAHVGGGYWGKNLVRNFAELGVLSAITDTNQDQALALSQEHGAPVRSLEEVLADPEITAVSFATPAETHAALAIRALEANKHVYMEKPLALSVADGEKVLKLAQAKDRKLMVGHLLQYHGVFVKLRELVKAGELGQIRHLYSNRMSFGKFRLEENVWWSFAPHDISMVLSLVAEEPNSVSAQGGCYVTPGVADWCTAQFGFASGVNAHFNISWYHPFKEHRLVVVGDNGMAVFEDSNPDWNQKLTIYRHGIDRPTGLAPTPAKANAEFVMVDKNEPLKAECQHFIECIEQNITPLTDGTEGLAVLRALERGEAALQTSMQGTN